MLALLLVAAAVGVDNFAAALGFGVVTGVNARARLEVGLVFGVFEGGMPVLGLVLGHGVAHDLGSAAKPVGGVLLGLLGAYGVGRELWQRRSRATKRRAPDVATPDEPEAARSNRRRLARLVVTAAVLALDNLVVGFALGTYHVAVLLAASVIAAVSVVLSLAGLEIGARIGARLGDFGDLVGGVVLIAVGVAIGTGLL